MLKIINYISHNFYPSLFFKFNQYLDLFQVYELGFVLLLLKFAVDTNKAGNIIKL